jgi:hypothetical protein
MPYHEISIEDVLCKTKDRKSNKKYCPKKNDCKDNCKVECNLPECNPECCTAAFQRLDKLRMNWNLIQTGLVTIIPYTVYNRTAHPVNIPEKFTSLEAIAAGFVNTVRYLNYEECGKLDQVTGWTIDVQMGDLYFYQDLPDLGLLTTDSRSEILNTSPTDLTPYDKRKLTEMEPFWKLSIKAIERIKENPKTEGNICEIKDKCGNKFLIAINRASTQSTLILEAGNIPGQSICDYNSKYSIVAIKLC